jgi:hypothetical protein
MEALQDRPKYTNHKQRTETVNRQLWTASELTRVGKTRLAHKAITASSARSLENEPTLSNKLRILTFRIWILVAERKYAQALTRLKALLELQRRYKVEYKKRCRTTYLMAELTRELGHEAESKLLFEECLGQVQDALGEKHFVLDLIRERHDKQKLNVTERTRMI